jgi:hypothetical protein
MQQTCTPTGMVHLAKNKSSVSRAWINPADADACLRGGVFIGLAVAGLGAAVWLSSSDQELGLKLLFGFLFGLVCPVLCSAIGVYLLRVSSSKQHYKLGKVQGRIGFSRHINRRTRNPVYGYLVLHIATKRFSVPEHIPSIMRSGDEYLLYYITRAGSSTIVSATVVAPAA